MAWLRRSAPAEPLAVSMAAIKLGDRLLVAGVGDPVLAAALAIKTGLTGRVAAVDADAARVDRVRSVIEQEGALVELSQAPWDALPFDAGSFDVAVVPDALTRMPADVRARASAELHRVLRDGGRVLVIESTPRGWFGSRRPALDPQYAASGGAAAALQAAGFAAVRSLAERDGVSYVEARK